MDDTAEIKAQLDRIGALASGGAENRTLLEEVRRLLEEGERALRGAAAAEPPGEAGATGGARRKPGSVAAAPVRVGEGAAVT